MTPGTGTRTISGHPQPVTSRSTGETPPAAGQAGGRGQRPLASGAARCADAARTRGEPIAASAVPYRRYLLLEAPGAWGRAPDEGCLSPGLAPLLDRAGADAGMNVVLIRRAGRGRPAPGGDARRAWAIADTTVGSERVQWGSWAAPAELLGLDLTAPLPASAARSGPQRVALTCTNGKRDLCCAVRGRPVAEALSAVGGWDCWESSHLGGHRFAATVMLLPTGDMFGWLDPRTAVTAVERFDAGQFLLPHYRGRSGLPFPLQAALHTARVRLGDCRRHALTVTAASRVTAAAAPAGTGAGHGDAPGGQPGPADQWQVLVSHRAEPGRPSATYRVTVAGTAPSSALLSCGDDRPRAEVRYTAVAFCRVRP
jgi:hypothetical protein